MSSAQIALRCPSCSAPLLPQPNQPAIRCEHCGATTVVPAFTQARDLGRAATATEKSAAELSIPRLLHERAQVASALHQAIHSPLAVTHTLKDIAIQGTMAAAAIAGACGLFGALASGAAGFLVGAALGIPVEALVLVAAFTYYVLVVKSENAKRHAYIEHLKPQLYHLDERLAHAYAVVNS